MHTSAVGFFPLTLASLVATVVFALPNAGSAIAPAITADPATADAPVTAATHTVVWSTTQTSVTYPLWVPATAVTMVTTQTVTTLIPEQTADGTAGVVETVIGHTTYEYRLGYSDGHSSTSWSSATRSYVMTMG